MDRAHGESHVSVCWSSANHVSCCDWGTAELVAVKIVDKTKLTPESLQQHNLEVKLLSRLSEHEHPNIVRLYQVINTKSKLYLVMGESKSEHMPALSLSLLSCYRAGHGVQIDLFPSSPYSLQLNDSIERAHALLHLSSVLFFLFPPSRLCRESEVYASCDTRASTAAID